MSAGTTKTMGPIEWGLLLLSVLWGGSFFFGKVAVAEEHHLLRIRLPLKFVTQYASFRIMAPSQSPNHESPGASSLSFAV